MNLKLLKLGGVGSTWLIVVVTIVSFSLGGSTVQAQDTIGIYFDEEGLTTHFQTTEVGEWIDAWLIIKDLSSEDGLFAFAASAKFEGEIYAYCWMSLIGAQDIMCAPEWILGATHPIPQSETIVVVKMWFRMPSNEARVDIYVQPAVPDMYEGRAVYQTNSGELRTLYSASGSYDEPVASLNGAVPLDASSWGKVKALYR